MASIGQFKVRAKVIIVAAIGKEFKKSRIIGKIIDAAKEKNHLAKGQLINPSRSRSITPFADDRWLIRKDAVKVSAVRLPSQEYMISHVTVRVRYGLNYKYQNLSRAFSEGSKWFPPVNAIARWIESKKGQGQFTDVSPKNIKRVAYAIALKIQEDGVKQTNFADAFFDKRTGVKPTLRKGIAAASRRLERLYATSIENSINKIIKL